MPGWALLLRWPASAVVAGALLAGGAAAGYGMTRAPDHDFGTVPAASASVTGGPRAAGDPRRGGSGTAGRSGVVATAVPALLRIPAIGVSARIVPVGVAADGMLGIPADPAVVGWWAGGSYPGLPAGSTVLVGHVDSASAGPGALFHLEDLRPGALITVTAGSRAWHYVVRAMRAYSKARLPAAVIFGQRVPARLVIVTCGGPFNSTTGHYLDNVVAYALPADG